MRVITIAEKTLDLIKDRMGNYAVKEFEECKKNKQKKSFLIEGEALAIVLTDQ